MLIETVPPERFERKIEFSLFGSQIDFVQDLTSRYTAFVGGFRSGKTYALMAKCVVLAANNPESTGAICLPTIGMGMRGFITEWETFLWDHDVQFERNDAFHGGGYNLFFNGVPTRILILSSENFMRARNLELSFFALDESDAMVGTRAWDAWNLFISRLSGGHIRHGLTVSTPEGFGFLHDTFQQQLEDKEDLRKFYKLYRGSTYDNPTLPDDYIPNLVAKYPPQLIKAYLHGEFVNLTSGPVYVNYNPEVNNSKLTLADLPEGSNLRLGLDFNINNMSCITLVIKDGKVHAIDEIIGSKDTPGLIEAIKDRYSKYKCILYPDASSNNSNRSASVSDLAQLKAAGFELKVLTKNPRIRDRVSSVNALFCNGLNEHKLAVNRTTCKTLHRCLSQQIYNKDGLPVKDNIMDGPLDAFGYPIYFEFPVKGTPTVRVT